MVRKPQDTTHTDRRRKGRQKQVQRRRHKPEKTTILVGTPWPPGITVTVESIPSDPKDCVIIAVAVLSNLLLTAVVAYAMAVSNADLLNRAFSVIQYGLGIVIIWAMGKKAIHEVKKMPYDQDEIH